jgi:hypothetical protein
MALRNNFNTKILVFTFVLVLVMAAITLASKAGYCAWCPSYTCVNSNMCGDGCVCLIPSGSMSGNCYGMD